MKLVVMLLAFVGMMMLTALVGSVFVYIGWNWGLVPALDPHLKKITLLNSLWLSVLFAILRGGTTSKCKCKHE